MDKCHNPDMLLLGYPVDGCKYKLKQRLTNVTIEVLECEKCGHIEIAWYPQENTEDVTGESEYE